jgi:hypothetical protein
MVNVCQSPLEVVSKFLNLWLVDPRGTHQSGPPLSRLRHLETRLRYLYVQLRCRNASFDRASRRFDSPDIFLKSCAAQDQPVMANVAVEMAAWAYDDLGPFSDCRGMQQARRESL